MMEEGSARPSRASKRPRRGATADVADEAPGTSGSEYSSGEEEDNASEVRLITRRYKTSAVPSVHCGP